MKMKKFVVKDIIDEGFRLKKKLQYAGNDKCKTCEKEERRSGSAYCQECSDNYKRNNPLIS